MFANDSLLFRMVLQWFFSSFSIDCNGFPQFRFQRLRFPWFPLVSNGFGEQVETAIVPGFAFAWRQFGAVFCTGTAHPVRIQCMLRRRAPHSSLSGSPSTSGSAVGMSGVGYASEAR